LDADHCIGHGYLMSCSTDEEVIASFAKNILPLLREYFYGNEGLIKLVLSEAIDGAPCIFIADHASSSFSNVFGIDQDAAVDYGYRPGTGARTLRLDERFWMSNELVAKPGDIQYAASCLRKIYQWPDQMSAEASSLTAEPPSSQAT